MVSDGRSGASKSAGSRSKPPMPMPDASKTGVSCEKDARMSWEISSIWRTLRGAGARIAECAGGAGRASAEGLGGKGMRFARFTMCFLGVFTVWVDTNRC